jgi:hypothetical protein
LRCLGALSPLFNHPRASHVFSESTPEVRKIRIILKHHNCLIRLDADHRQARCAEPFCDSVDRSAGREGHTKNQMWGKALDCWNAARFGFDLFGPGEERFPELGPATTIGPGRSKAQTFSTGWISFHPDQRQVRMPLIFRMVWHVT